MIDKNLLEDMSHIKIKDVAPDLLQDILTVEVSGETASQRLESYLDQVGNPYCFRVGNTPVRISFKSCGETLDNKIKSYFMGLKS
ncbi:MAG: hypothetical protein HFF49_01205 [Lawsonibacter sp.]|jgi:hypothetical protein|nr:hypothetical protein [Lawsonibacter sp.]